MTTIFDRIRTSCAAVAEVSTHVRIDESALPAFAASLDLARPHDDPAQRGHGDDEATAAFVIALDAVNFGSGWFPWLRKRPGHSGYGTVAASLEDHVVAHGPITADRLAAFDLPQVAALFDQPLDGGPTDQLMAHFTEAWHALAAFVRRVGDGSFLGVIDAAGGSAARMVELLDEMPYFHDVHRHPDVGDVLLYKRAQIVAHDLAVAFDHRGPGGFDDHHRLTMFPDNLVPHVLRVAGVLRFRDDLVARIDAVEDIAVGSAAEIEIRACGLRAVELLRSEIADRGHEITSAELDNVLWTLGGDPEYKAVPRHRSRSVFY